MRLASFVGGAEELGRGRGGFILPAPACTGGSGVGLPHILGGNGGVALGCHPQWD